MSEQAVKGLGAGSGDGEWVSDFMLTEPGQRHSVFKVKQDGSGAFLNLPYPTGVTATVSSGGSLTASTEFFFVVTSLNQNGETIASAEVNGLTTGSNQTITVAWTSVPGALSYNVYLATTSNGYGASSLISNVLATASPSLAVTATTVTTGQPPTSTTAYILATSAFPANQLGRVYSDLTGESNTSSTSAQTLCTVTLPPNCLSVNKMGFKVRAWGVSASNADSKVLALKFGTATLVTVTSTASGPNWYLEAECYRTGATTQTALGWSVITATWAQTQSAPTQTLSSALAVALSFTGSAGNATDVTVGGFVVELVG